MTGDLYAGRIPSRGARLEHLARIVYPIPSNAGGLELVGVAACGTRHNLAELRRVDEDEAAAIACGVCRRIAGIVAPNSIAESRRAA